MSFTQVIRLPNCSDDAERGSSLGLGSFERVGDGLCLPRLHQKDADGCCYARHQGQTTMWASVGLRPVGGTTIDFKVLPPMLSEREKLLMLSCWQQWDLTSVQGSALSQWLVGGEYLAVRATRLCSKLSCCSDLFRDSCRF